MNIIVVDQGSQGRYEYERVKRGQEPRDGIVVDTLILTTLSASTRLKIESVAEMVPWSFGAVALREGRETDPSPPVFF